MKTIDDILKENKAKQEPYKVPDGYFEDFTARLNAKIDAIEADKVSQIEEDKPAPMTQRQKVWLTLKPLLYVAAAITVLYAATYIIVQPKVNRAVSQMASNTESGIINEAEQEYDDYFQYVLDEDGIEGEDLLEYCYLE